MKKRKGYSKLGWQIKESLKKYMNTQMIWLIKDQGLSN